MCDTLVTVHVRWLRRRLTGTLLIKTDMQQVTARQWYSAFRNFFPKFCLILKIDFWSDWAPNFRKDSLCHPLAPNFFFGVVMFKITAEFRFFSPFPWKRSIYNSFFHKLCLIITHWFLVRFSSNFQEKLLMPSSYPNFLFVWLFLV